ncbi:MAG: TIGR01777 family protein [Gammaproteobacteria bacterium]|nr:TIGR01777 family protein [Gammaproteobacteria bacterium]
MPLNGRHVLLTGGTGFVGRHLVDHLRAQGARITVLSRRPGHALKLLGTDVTVVGALAEVADDCHFNAIINLAGAPVIGMPWTAQRRRTLVRSRLNITRDLVRFIAAREQRPDVFITASAIGFYGIGDHVCDETVAPTDDFQSRLCQVWEAAARGVRRSGVRVVTLRLGVVLGRDGGAFPRLLLCYRLGVGTRFADGRQWLSWIHIDDVVGLIDLAISDEAITGALNATAPEAVRQAEFAEVVGAGCGCWLTLPVPRRVMTGLLGEMSQLFVDGQRVVPAAALAHDYRFRYAEFASAVNALLAR